MSTTLNAVFEHGAFVPESHCDLPEGARVTLEIRYNDSGKNLTEPLISDPGERRKVLEEVIQSMMANPIPADAPRLTREQIHERG